METEEQAAALAEMMAALDAGTANVDQQQMAARVIRGLLAL